MARMRATRSRPLCAGMWLRSIRRSSAACAVLTAAVLAAAIGGCGTRPAPGAGGAPHGPARAVLTATFPLPGILGVATGGGAAWVTTGNAVLRIDPRTDRAGQVLSDPGASLTSIAFGAGSLWVKDAAGILRVDPVTGSVTARIGVHAAVLSFGEGALWALGYIGSGPLVRIDPASYAVRTFPLPPGKIWDLAAGEGAVWISVAVPPSVGLLRVDPATGRVAARISGNHLSRQVAVGDGAVWASDGAAVAQINPRTDRVTTTTPLLSPLPASGPSPILNGSGLLAAAPGVVWVTAAGHARHVSVLRIDPRTARLAGAGLRVGRQPQAVAASGTTLWVVTAQAMARVDLVTCAQGRCARPAPGAVAVPQTAGPFGPAQFFSARQGLLIPGLHTPGRVLCLTSDGGQTWTPIRQGMRFQTDITVNFVTPDAGFAWNPNTPGAPPIHATTDGGRTWAWYLPQLARGQR